MMSIGHGGPEATGRLEWPSASIVLEALSQFVSPAAIHSVLRQTGRESQRIRRLPAAATVWLVIAIGIWTDLDIPAIWRQVVGTLRSLFLAVASRRAPSKSALSQARTRLGPRPLRQLFVQTAGPIALDQTRGAFYKGMRLRVIDGVTFEMPDTPANVAALGRPRTRRNGESVEGGYPQLHAILLAEVGTHTIVEALIKPGKSREYPVAGYLLAKAPRGSLVLQDRGFYGYRQFAEATRLGVELLGRVGAHVVFERTRTLRDGSYLATIYPSQRDRRHQTNGLTVRVIEYTLDEPNRPGHGEHHRLVTTLLDAQAYPAKELAVLYHDRWEIEIGNDEVKTHPLNRPVPLRSRTPCGVLQELYGVLLAYNAVRVLMHEAALAVDVDPRRLSFIHAVRVIRETAPLMRAAPACQLPSLYAAMIQPIALGQLPPRENRVNPRVIKKKMSKFRKKRSEHYHVPQPKRPFEDSVAILK